MQDQVDSNPRRAHGRRIGDLAGSTGADGAAPVRETDPAPLGATGLLLRHRPVRQVRTSPAVAHVAAHFASKIALDQAAALCRLSPSQFCRIFKMEQSVSFAQFLLRFRLERASEYLAHPNVQVKEVAYAVGFNDLSYFARVFKRQFGVSPRQFQAGARSS